jgi:hypothetical protein
MGDQQIERAEALHRVEVTVEDGLGQLGLLAAAGEQPPAFLSGDPGDEIDFDPAA